MRLNIFRDIEGLAAQGALRAKLVTSKTRHIWMTYIIPNVIFQAIINLPLGYRGFSHAAAAIADRVGPGVDRSRPSPDFAITFMFVCSFTFLGVMAHTAADMYEGEIVPIRARRAESTDTFFFVLILLMGVGVGIVFALVPRVTGVETVFFGLSLTLKFLVVFLSVYVACRLGVGWMGRINDAVAHKMAVAH